eukprot:EG_transcript_14295
MAAVAMQKYAVAAPEAFPSAGGDGEPAPQPAEEAEAAPAPGPPKSDPQPVAGGPEAERGVVPVQKPRLNRGGGGFGRKNPAEGFRNEWHSSMFFVPCKNPIMCCLSCFCPWCCAFRQRRQLLEFRMENYTCCADICSCVTDSCMSCIRPCPNFCLCLEVFCCLGCAVHGNRWLVQRRYQLENQCCDLCLMWTSCICSCLACITGEDWLEFAADVLYYSVIGCMLAQHDYEMKMRNFPNEAPVVQSML